MPLILVIEDNEAIRENTVELLELEGFNVIAACNGEEGLSLVLERSPDLILSDVHMPYKNGYEVLQTLKSSDDTNKIPFIFLTSDSESKDIETGMVSGAAGYLIKPFVADDLFNVVRKFCKESA